MSKFLLNTMRHVEKDKLLFENLLSDQILSEITKNVLDAIRFALFNSCHHIQV